MIYSDLVKSRSGLIAYWRVGEASGTSGADSSGNGRPLSFSSVTWNGASALTADANKAWAGGAGTAAAGSQWVFGTGDFAVEMWIKSTQTDTRVALGCSAAPAWWVGISSSGKPTISANGTNVTTASKTVNDGNYHHVAYKRVSGVASFVIDGVAYSGGALAGSAGVSGTAVGFGAFESGSFGLTGGLDEVAVYKGTVPTDAQFIEHYNAGVGSYSVKVDNVGLWWNPNTVKVTGSTSAKTANTGPMLKTTFSGTKWLGSYDAASLVAAARSSGLYPSIVWKVDGGSWQTQQLSASASEVTFGSSLANTTHTLEVHVKAVNNYGDVWTTPVDAVSFVGFSGDSTSPAVTAPTLASEYDLFFGDSITEGLWNLGTSTDTTQIITNSDATQGWAHLLAAQIGSEHGNVGFGGQTLASGAGLGNIPQLLTSYASFASGASRLTGGKFLRIPTRVWVNIGTNSGALAADIQTLIGSIRAACDATTKIGIIVPFKQTSAANITQGVSDYKAANPTDTAVYLIDLGANGVTWSTSTGSGYSYDGLHPSAAGDALLAPAAYSASQSVGMIVVLSYSPSSASYAAGATVTVSATATGWAAGDDVSIDIIDSGGNPTTVGAGTVDADGGFSIDATIPADASGSGYYFHAVDSQTSATIDGPTFTVTAATSRSARNGVAVGLGI